MLIKIIQIKPFVYIFFTGSDSFVTISLVGNFFLLADRIRFQSIQSVLSFGLYCSIIA